jgi:hypothetical protein
MKYTTRQSTLSARGRANVQVDKRTRDEIKALAEKHNISQGVMCERLVMAWLAEERRVKRMIEGEG